MIITSGSESDGTAVTAKKAKKAPPVYVHLLCSHVEQ